MALNGLMSSKQPKEGTVTYLNSFTQILFLKLGRQREENKSVIYEMGHQSDLLSSHMNADCKETVVH